VEEGEVVYLSEQETEIPVETHQVGALRSYGRISHLA